MIVARVSSTIKVKVGGGESVVIWLQETDLAVEIASKANGSKFVTNCTRDSAANSPTIIGRFWFGARCFLRFFWRASSSFRYSVSEQKRCTNVLSVFKIQIMAFFKLIIFVSESQDNKEKSSHCGCKCFIKKYNLNIL